MLMTGDAISIYMLSLQRVLEQLGVSVRLYADYIAPLYHHSARPTSAYQPTGQDILWFHYSIWSDNFSVLDRSDDFKVMDYHGVTPPHLSVDFDPRLAELCRKAINEMPALSRVFDWCIYHAEDGRRDLEQAGYTRFSQVRLPVDTTALGVEEDRELSAMLDQLDYILFVGRIVPQKDVLSIVRVFAEVNKHCPQVCLLLVGSTGLLPGYVQRVRDEIKRLNLERRVRLIGQITDRTALTSLFCHAKFLVVLSEWESFCVPAVEAMFFGLPVIHEGKGPVAENVGDAGIVIDKSAPDRAGKQIALAWGAAESYAQLRADALRRSSSFTDAALAGSLRDVLGEWAQAFGVSRLQ